MTLCTDYDMNRGLCLNQDNLDNNCDLKTAEGRGGTCNLYAVETFGPLPAGGAKADEGKLPLDLLAYDALRGTAQVLRFGAEKYAPRNWEKGIKYGRVFAALQRHMTSWWMGEDLDPETGLSHLHHAGCCIMFLQAYHERGMPELDDRPAQTDRGDAV